MSKDVKVFLALIVLSILAVVRLATLKSNSASEPLTTLSQIEVSPQNLDLGDVSINGGTITKEFEIKNTGQGPITLSKIVTSCMCTEAKAVIGDRESRFFGMEHPGDRNAPFNYKIDSGETAKIIVNFDPAAHGPAGVGPFDREVQLIFKDPAGVQSITFNGTVVN